MLMGRKHITTQLEKKDRSNDPRSKRTYKRDLSNIVALFLEGINL